MKKITLLAFFILAFQFLYGQACGIYRIKYVGKVSCKRGEIQLIKLPSVPFLHGYEEMKSEWAFVDTKLEQDTINLMIRSPITSQLFDEPGRYLTLYKGERATLPVIFVIQEDSNTREITVELAWEAIKMTKIEDGNFGNLFEIDLSEIKVDR